MHIFLYILLFLCTLTGCDAKTEPQSTPPQTVQEKVFPPSPEVLFITSTDLMTLDNKSAGWGFRRMTPDPPEFTANQIALMEKYQCIYQGNDTEPVLYLTFDEGYENGYTAQILDVLKETNTPAAFFVTGDYFRTAKDMVDRMVAEGHIVGNHAMNHKNLPHACTDIPDEEELLSLDRAFFAAYGIPMRYMRPPEGEYSERVLALAGSLGYKTAFWSFAYADWDKNAQKGADYAYSQVIKNLHNGCVILLHAVSPDNANALARIIEDAKHMGYTFRSLDDYQP